MSAVFVYVHDLRSSGVVRNALAITERIARDRPAALVAGYADGMFLADARAAPYPLHLLVESPPPRPSRRSLVSPLRALVGRERPALLLSAGQFGHSTVWLASRLGGLPPRLYLMSNAVARPGRLATLVKTLATRAQVADAARVTLVSGTVAASPAFARALRTGRAEIVPNGVDTAAAIRAAAAPAPHGWLEQGVPVVLGIGRLHGQKNFPLLIDAVARARRGVRMRLAIVGGGSPAIAADLAARAEAAGLGEDFVLAGETDNVFAWAARARVYALPSRWEGSSVALLEAMAVGTPVVATRQAGDAAHVLDDGRYGLLTDADDVEGFAAAIERQLGADRVLPGDRAAAFTRAAMLDRYAGIAAELCAPLSSQSPRDHGPVSRGPVDRQSM